MAEPSAAQKRMLAKMGLAMPDGSYYIRNGSVGASDLQNAIDAVGRGEPQDTHNAIRVHIMKRAKALGLSDKIPADWNSDGSLKHADGTDLLVKDFLEHFGVLGMRWGHHLPGVEALGGPGNGGQSPAPFIQPGDHTGNSGQNQNNKSPEQQANAAMSDIQAMHAQAIKEAEAARQEAFNAEHQPEGPSTLPSHPSLPAAAGKTPVAAAPATAAKKTTAAPAKTAKPKSKLTKKQATAVHAATKKHVAKMASVHKAAKAAHAAHNAKTKAAKAKSAKAHAAHMNHLKKVAQNAHAAHKAHVAHIKGTHVPLIKTHVSQLTAADKKELSKLSLAQRHALTKLSPAQRTQLAKLTPAERTALSKLTPKQLAQLHNAQLASAKKRHDAAVAKKQGSVQVKAVNAQHDALDHDQVGEFLEHFGVRGMKWGVRRNGGHPGRIPAGASEDHKQVVELKAKVKKAGGIHALSTEELRKVNDRINAEANYHRLNPQTGGLEKGRQFIKSAVSDTKTVLDAVDTGRRVLKEFEGTKKAA